MTYPLFSSGIRFIFSALFVFLLVSFEQIIINLDVKKTDNEDYKYNCFDIILHVKTLTYEEQAYKTVKKIEWLLGSY